MSTLLSSLAARLLPLTPASGHFRSAIDGVVLMRADATTSPAPVLQEPTMVFMVQGLKRGYLGDEIYPYHAGQCLTVAVPMHFTCDTVVDDSGPMLAVAVRIDMATVSDILTRMQAHGGPEQDNTHRGMIVSELNASAQDSLLRLLNALAVPEEARVLGSQLVRELHYRVLQGAAGSCLSSLAAWKGRLGPIFRACDHLRLHYAEEVDVPSLARAAHMSESAFYLAFKAVTGCSPIQYLKATRLQRARELIAIHGQGSAQSAYDVGYASPSQFSREFKRLFGYSPAQAEQMVQEHI